MHTNHAFGHTGLPFIDGWLHWDAGWYLEIARHGYSYAPNRQSSVAFFPLYPLAMRAVGTVVGGPLAAGMILTIVSGATASVLFASWLAVRFDEETARTGIFLFVLGPYSFYLFGAVYSDAMFVAATLAAFVLLERRRPVLAGLAGAIATAARPVGIIVIIALVLRTRELRADSSRQPLSRAAARARNARPFRVRRVSLPALRQPDCVHHNPIPMGPLAEHVDAAEGSARTRARAHPDSI